ncbi:E3 SUMO-protein ligase ZBED1 [Frankliniella fusca]|uniref:E3 SUMO-protein ligase ZBED1 n=1 Tax=Frankliniella fusca TaxID=407009 RepID=A0AAE1LX87_9NEOP|nr:E3 SUMO-protein ligase ZBED1 [Frankliniella fusca]
MKAKVATFLWPDYKDLTMLSEEERQAVIAKVCEEIGPSDPDDIATPPPPKVSRLDKYSKYKKQQVHEPQDEVQKYMSMSATDRLDGLPKLAKLAMRELCKLATAAPSERVWSKAGFILNNRRNRLTPKHLNSMIFLGSVLLKMEKKQN